MAPVTSSRKRKNLAKPWGWYTNTYPTHHYFDADVLTLVLSYEAEFKGAYLNTYKWHPPAVSGANFTWEYRSFDVWDARGRGWALDPTLGAAMFDRIFDDPRAPYIAWIIYYGWMWTPEKGWEVWDPEEDGSDPGHYQHIHVSYRFPIF